MMDLLKHAGKLRGQVEELKNLVVDGSAGGGMVRVRLSGRFELLDCQVEPQVLQEKDAEMLEDLFVAATNQALKKLLQAWAEKTGLAAAGLGINSADLFGPAAGGAGGAPS
jgi:DNA-binding YbaB/EbfC family protein